MQSLCLRTQQLAQTPIAAQSDRMCSIWWGAGYIFWLLDKNRNCAVNTKISQCKGSSCMSPCVVADWVLQALHQPALAWDGNRKGRRKWKMERDQKKRQKETKGLLRQKGKQVRETKENKGGITGEFLSDFIHKLFTWNDWITTVWCRNNLQSLCYSEPIAPKAQNLHRRESPVGKSWLYTNFM